MKKIILIIMLIVFPFTLLAQGQISRRTETPVTNQSNVKKNATSCQGGVINGHGYVDLGLPSGTIWATCNVGAFLPQEDGDYFAWGEIKPKDEYTLSTYQISNIIIDSKGLLKPRFDVLFNNWGELWRLPTKDEFKELIEECVWEWSSIDGKYGYKVEGHNGLSIFLPAAGYKNENKIREEGQLGRYWCSSTGQIESKHDEVSNLYGLSDALCFYNPIKPHFLDNVGHFYIYHAAIYMGFSIRGVYKTN